MTVLKCVSSRSIQKKISCQGNAVMQKWNKIYFGIILLYEPGNFNFKSNLKDDRDVLTISKIFKIFIHNKKKLIKEKDKKRNRKKSLSKIN